MTVKSIPLFPPVATASRGRIAPEPDKIEAKALQKAFQNKGDDDGKVIFLRGGHGIGQSLDEVDRDASLTTTQPKGVKHRELAEMAGDAKREIRAILIASAADAELGGPVVSPGQHLIAHEGGGFTRVHTSAPEQSPGQQRIAGIFDRVTASKPGVTRGDLDKIMVEIGFRQLDRPVLKRAKAGLQEAVNGAAVVKGGKGLLSKVKHAFGDVWAGVKNAAPVGNKVHFRRGGDLQAQAMLGAQAYQEGDASPSPAADKTLANRAALKLAPNAVAVYSSVSKFAAVKAVRAQIEASDLPAQVKQELKDMCQSLQHGFVREAAIQGTVGSLKTAVSVALKLAGDPALFDGVAEALSSPAEAFAEFASEKLAGLGPDIDDAWSLSGDMVGEAGEEAAQMSGKKAAGKGLDLGGRQLADGEEPPVSDADGSKQSDFDDGMREGGRLPDDDHGDVEGAFDELQEDGSASAATQRGLRKGEMTQEAWAGALQRFCSDVPVAGLDAPHQQAEVRQFAEEIVACVHKKFSAQSALVKMAASNPAVAAQEIFARQQGVAQADELAKAEKKLGKALGLMEH
jgi:hypothetical protein